VLFVPVMHLIFLGIISGLGFILSAVFVYFRDLNQIWEVVTNVFFFATPIFYPLSVVPVYLMPYYLSNPITRLILMYRDIIINGVFPSLDSFILVIGTAVVLIVAGWYIFSSLQKRFAEVI
jgi:lipopolysaccharide transport system permease protein